MQAKNKNSLTERFFTKAVVFRFFLIILGFLAIASATLLVIEIKAERDDAVQVLPLGKLVSLDSGQRLHIHCTGSGSPVVILEAGMGGNSLGWNSVQKSISKTTRVCSYDRAGYGWSDEATSVRSVDNEEKELYELLQKAGIRPPYLIVGHSYGAYIARLFAARHNDRMSSLLLIDPPHEDNKDRNARPPAYTDPFVSLNLRLSLVKAHLGLIRHEYTSNYTENQPQTKEQAAFLASSKNFKTMLHEYDELSHSSQYMRDAADSSGSIPTTYIVTSHRMPRAKDFCGLSLRCTVKDSGGEDHLIPQNNPNIVIDAIHDLLRTR